MKSLTKSTNQRSTNQRDEILSVVRRIPIGCVATYGQIAALAGFPRNARQVGSILGSLPTGNRIPWHRVVNSQGRISARGESSDCQSIQRERLEDEGVDFLPTGRIDLKEFGWQVD